MERKDGTRKYGNMGISYRILSEASGCSEYKIMTYVRLLEPMVDIESRIRKLEKMDKKRRKEEMI